LYFRLCQSADTSDKRAGHSSVDTPPTASTIAIQRSNLYSANELAISYKESWNSPGAIETKYTMNGSFLILLVASVLVSGSWHRGEALQPERQDDDDGSGGTRGRRSVRLIMPGTRWCGTGNVSSADGQSYGNIVATDRCCQQHDRCAHTIGAFSMKYGLFNYRFHTISHCECDDVYVTLCNIVIHAVFNYKHSGIAN